MIVAQYDGLGLGWTKVGHIDEDNGYIYDNDYDKMGRIDFDYRCLRDYRDISFSRWSDGDPFGAGAVALLSAFLHLDISNAPNPTSEPKPTPPPRGGNTYGGSDTFSGISNRKSVLKCV